MDKYFCLHLNKRFNKKSLSIKPTLPTNSRDTCENKNDNPKNNYVKTNNHYTENLKYIEKHLLMYLP